MTYGIRLPLLRATCATAIALIATGCTNDISLNMWDYTKVDKVSPQGSAFDTALFKEYAELSRSEADQGDYADANIYARKAMMVARPAPVSPDDMDGRALKKQHRDTLSIAREKLLKLLDNGGRDAEPGKAAHAQAMFDCWVEQQEEGFQADHIAACRGAFEDAIAAVQVAMTPPPAPKKVIVELQPVTIPKPVGPFVVMFDNNSAALSADGRTILNNVATEFKRAKPKILVIDGHADLTGSDDHNDQLSLKRAEMVADTLSRSGVAKELIRIKGHGARSPKIQTPPKVSEPRNRIVEIKFER